MVIIWAAAVGGISFFEAHLGTAGIAAQTAHGAAEGVEVRIGTPGCSVFAASTTVTSTGAVSCFHDSLTPFGGGIALFDIALGEIAPGGIGAGMYGILVLAMVTVFVAGLMVGRTPEYIGKKIRPIEMKYASLYFLTLPVVILTTAAIAIGTHRGQSAIFNPGPHGLTEIVYAYASEANNNGSAFAGLGTAAPLYQITGGITMLLGRFAPEIFALGLAGSLARQAPDARERRDAGYEDAAVRRHARRRDPHPRRPDLLPRARAGTVRRRTALMSVTTKPRGPLRPAPGRPEPSRTGSAAACSTRRCSGSRPRTRSRSWTRGSRSRTRSCSWSRSAPYCACTPPSARRRSSTGPSWSGCG